MQKKHAFTLVELIVIITVIAILATIGFVSIIGYSENSRDSKRLTDLKSLGDVSELYKTQEGMYPIPEGGLQVTYSGAEIWTQGKFGENLRKQVAFLTTISETPVDPLTKSEYTYSVLNSRREYQLGSIIESTLFSYKPLGGTYAKEYSVLAKIIGNYNGQVAKVETGSTTFILAVPSIINSDPELSDYYQLLENKKLAYDGGKNLPWTYSGTINNISGEIGTCLVNTGNLIVYVGKIDTLSDKDNLRILAKNIQLSYSGTTISKSPLIKNILTLNINDDVELNNNLGPLINNSLGGNISIFSTNYASCTNTTTQGSIYDVIYMHSTLSTGERVGGLLNFPVFNGTENYTAIIGCNDGITTISNEYKTLKCDEGYVNQGGACITNDCDGLLPENTISNATEQQPGTSWTYNDVSGICTFSCLSNYTWDGSVCVADTRVCEVLNGSGTQYWTGTYWSDCDVNSCDTDFYKTSISTCSAVGVGYYSVDGSVLRTDCTNKPLKSVYTSDGSGSNNCEYDCNSGYILSGGSCIDSCSFVPLDKTTFSDILYDSKFINICMSNTGIGCNLGNARGETEAQLKLGKAWCNTKGYECGKTNEYESGFNGGYYYYNPQDSSWTHMYDTDFTRLSEVYCWD